MEDVKVSSHDHLDEFVAGGIVHRLRQKAWDKECASVAELSELWEAAVKIPQDAISRGSHGGINFETTNSTSRDIINSNEDIRLWQYTWGEIETY